MPTGPVYFTPLDTSPVPCSSECTQSYDTCVAGFLRCFFVICVLFCNRATIGLLLGYMPASPVDEYVVRVPATKIKSVGSSISECIVVGAFLA